MKITKVEDYKPILIECYASDPELTSKWHQVAGSGVSACIEKEYHDLRAANVSFFVVTEGALIGYFCKEVFQGQESLTGFFLMPKVRTKEIRAQFWELIRANFRKPFFCGLYERNVPAKRYIESKGGTPIKKSTLPDGPAVLYKVN